MGIVNRRNAVLGWMAWQAGKRVAKRKAKGAVPGVARTKARPWRPLLAVLAAVSGAVWLWRRRGGAEPVVPEFDVAGPADGGAPEVPQPAQPGADPGAAA